MEGFQKKIRSQPLVEVYMCNYDRKPSKHRVACYIVRCG